MATALSTTDPQVRAAHERRLRRLQLRAAQEGIATPPEIAGEIEDIRAALGGAVSLPATEGERYELLFGLIQEVRRDVRQLHWLMPILMVALCAFLVLLVKL